jgi:hypothetical protein
MRRSSVGRRTSSPPHLRDRIIIWAARKGFAGTIRKCLSAGSKILRRFARISLTQDSEPASAATVKGCGFGLRGMTFKASGKLILAKGVNANFLDEHYETPMRQAAGNGHVDVVQEQSFDCG